MPSTQYFPPSTTEKMNLSNAFTANNEADMLASGSSDNDTCFRSDINAVYTLIDTPANILSNWKMHPVPDVSVPAPNASVTAPLTPVANQIWTNASTTTVSGIVAGGTAIWTGTNWLCIEKPSTTTTGRSIARAYLITPNPLTNGVTTVIPFNWFENQPFGTWNNAGLFTFNTAGVYEVGYQIILGAAGGSPNYSIASDVGLSINNQNSLVSTTPKSLSTSSAIIVQVTNTHNSTCKQSFNVGNTLKVQANISCSPNAPAFTGVMDLGGGFYATCTIEKLS